AGLRGGGEGAAGRGRRSLGRDDAARGPGDRGQRERRLRQELTAAVSESRSALVVEAGRVRPDGPDAERDRLPPVLEGGVVDSRFELGLLQVAQSCCFEQLDELTVARAWISRLARDVGGELACRTPEEREHLGAAAGEIPDARGDGSSFARDSPHLSQPR